MFNARPDCVQTRALFFQIRRHAARAAARKIPAPGHHCAGERGLRLIKWYERMKRESYWAGVGFPPGAELLLPFITSSFWMDRCAFFTCVWSLPMR